MLRFGDVDEVASGDEMANDEDEEDELGGDAFCFVTLLLSDEDLFLLRIAELPVLELFFGDCLLRVVADSLSSCPRLMAVSFSVRLLSIAATDRAAIRSVWVYNDSRASIFPSLWSLL